MRYTKPFISIEDQLKTLQLRGLRIADSDLAYKWLETNSYYRLRAYTYPFQNNNLPDHIFVKDISFEEIIHLYHFDSSLRKLIFGCLEKIEIALRTQIIYQVSQEYGSHWQLDPSICRDSVKFAKHLQSLSEEINRSDETFIKHYLKKYSEPKCHPPCWMSLEIVSFGLLSKIYQNLKNGEAKQNVAAYFGLKKVETLENWMFCFSNLRNICAHHGRLWNRRLSSLPNLPYNTKYSFLTKGQTKSIYTNKIYAILCCIYYLYKQIDEKNTFKKDLLELMSQCPLKQEKEMGFTTDWREHEVWNN